MAGAAPAQSALTLRLVLAAFGLVVFASGAIVVALVGEPAWESIVLGLLAAVALVDLAVVGQRKHRGEPG
jgi:hypothetical protein